MEVKRPPIMEKFERTWNERACLWVLMTYILLAMHVVRD